MCLRKCVLRGRMKFRCTITRLGRLCCSRCVADHGHRVRLPASHLRRHLLRHTVFGSGQSCQCPQGLPGRSVWLSICLCLSSALDSPINAPKVFQICLTGCLSLSVFSPGQSCQCSQGLPGPSVYVLCIYRTYGALSELSIIKIYMMA